MVGVYPPIEIRIEARRQEVLFFTKGRHSSNRLPQHVVDSPSLNAFKNRYDKFTRQDNGQLKLYSFSAH